MAWRSVAIKLIALGVLFALAACASRRLHAGFDSTTFRSSPTVFGGVVNLAYGQVDLNNPERNGLVMEDVFMTKRRDLRFVPASVLHERIGVERHAHLLDHYRDGAGIDTSAYLMLAEAMGADARYLALARIESVSVAQNRETADSDYDVNTDNDNIIKSTERTVWITFNMFDLEARREIWSETRAVTVISKVTFPAPTGSGTWSLIKAALSSEPDYPPPPTAFDALDDGFAYFAASIPKR